MTTAGPATTAPAPVAAGPADLLRRLRTMDPLLVVLRASLVVLLVNSNDDPLVMAGVAVLCLVALPRPAVLRSPWPWAVAFVAVGARQLATWHSLDDHIVVTTYWCGAIAAGLGARDARATLALSARGLVGLVFAFAAGWKVLSGQFLDGTFFRYSLLFDDRFEVVGRTLAGTTDRIRDADAAAVARLLAGPGGGEVVLQEGPGGPALAMAFTWWGVLIEVAVALAFLLPLRGRWRGLRHGTLFAFVGTTYVVLPVGAFGALLLVLGAAQAESERLRTAYVAGIGAMVVWAAAWPLLFLR